ncbi:MAG: 3-deoxy-8-phosphooctulonate synthase [Bacteroidales bacterium]|nr:3-deoxy-8-phosphooctulonate synthase [Bacteroidales bacterium]
MLPKLSTLKHQASGNFLLIAGPCVVEDHENPFIVCDHLSALCERMHIPFAFKASYRKANRSSVSSFTGIGDLEALRILREVGERYGVPVVTDIHTAAEAAMAADYADVLQIPAFLCRQTDLLQAAAATGRTVNIKKGQFLSPEAMEQVAGKMRAFDCDDFMLTERGTTFGYQDLVVDFRGVPTMQRNGVPVVVDITHSLQQPNQVSGVTGGRPDMIETVARAAIAVGADGIFMETHPDPPHAKSDGANMLRLELAGTLLEHLVAIRQTINNL